MDYETIGKGVVEVVETSVREDIYIEMIQELKSESYDDEREWADGVAEWIWSNFGGVDPKSL